MLLYPELVTSTIEVDGVFFCEVSPGVLKLDLAVEGAFVLCMELATSTIEVEGAFFCMGATKARVHSVFYS